MTTFKLHIMEDVYISTIFTPGTEYKYTFMLYIVVSYKFKSFYEE